jgi:hypothetical protein
VALCFNSGFYSYYMPGGKDVEEGLAALKKQKEGKTFPPLTPVSYDTATGKFECVPAADAYPGRGVMGGYPQFLYLSGCNRFIAAGKGRTALYDPDKKTWTMVKEADGQGVMGSDTAACYDSKRKRVYAASRDKARRPNEKAVLMTYDVGTSKWSEVSTKGKYPQDWSNRNVSLHYDSANDVVVAIHYSDEKIYVYDPEKDGWGEPVATRAGLLGLHKRGHAFYDPELNAHFVFAAGDSADDGVMWAYRWGKGKDAK